MTVYDIEYEEPMSGGNVKNKQVLRRQARRRKVAAKIVFSIISVSTLALICLLYWNDITNAMNNSTNTCVNDVKEESEDLLQRVEHIFRKQNRTMYEHDTEHEENSISTFDYEDDAQHIIDRAMLLECRNLAKNKNMFTLVLESNNHSKMTHLYEKCACRFETVC